MAMKPSDKIAMWALISGAVAAGAVWMFFDVTTWWVLLIIGLVVTGAIYSAALKQTAAERVVDRDLGSR